MSSTTGSPSRAATVSGMSASRVANVAVATERPPSARASARTESASSWTLPIGAASSPASGSALSADAGTARRSPSATGSAAGSRATPTGSRILRHLQRAVLEPLEQHGRRGVAAVEQGDDAFGSGAVGEVVDGGERDAELRHCGAECPRGCGTLQLGRASAPMTAPATGNALEGYHSDFYDDAVAPDGSRAAGGPRRHGGAAHA